MTNCINCGAILHGSKCEYCGTEYDNTAIVANFNNSDYGGTLRIGNEEIRVYIDNMESHIIDIEPYMDCDGYLHRSRLKMKRKFTLIEI